MAPTIFTYSLFASLISLAAAYTAQFGFNLMPCELCLAQRIPYAVVVVLALVGLQVQTGRKWVAYAIFLCFLTGGGIATYHAAVEKHIVTGPSACTSSANEPGQSVEDLLKKIQAAPNVACDKPQWEFHGITMASLNAVWSFILAGVTLVMYRKGKANADLAG